MSTIFTQYPEIAEVPLEPNNEIVKKAAWKKKMKKRLRKQEERLDKLAELHGQREQRLVDVANKKKDSFISKVGDAVVKALPSILAAAVPIFLSSLFCSKSNRKDR